MMGKFCLLLCSLSALAWPCRAADPQCTTGIPVNPHPRFGDACCAKECGSCDFTNCSSGSGTMDKCCGGLIVRGGVSCDIANPPCVVTTPSKPSKFEGTCTEYFFLHGQLLPGFAGGSAAQRQKWMDELMAVRKACQKGFNSSVFTNSALKWTQTTYVQPQMFPYDRYFYDPVLGQYTVDKYLDDLQSRYGGVDSILLWPTYPQLGTDNRNQFDMFDALPGGLNALKEAVSQLHARGVQVLYPYNPWDTSTRKNNVSDATAIADLLTATGGQGFNGDTMSDVKESFFDAAPDADRIAIEPELYGVPAMDPWHTIGWGEMWHFKDSAVPQPDFYKFALDARWMDNGVARWDKNHTQYIQNAYFGGIGFVSWENVWGCWNGIVPREGELLRRAATIQRFFGPQGFLTSESWSPFSENISSDVAYGSSFPHGSDTLHVLVNMVGRTTKASIQVPSSALYFDCYRGTPLQATDTDGGGKVVSVTVEALGLGCVLATTTESTELKAFLQNMANMTQRPLDEFSTEWNFLMQKMVSVGSGTNSSGMIKIPGASFHFQVSGVEIEGTSAEGVDVQYPWEAHPQKDHDHTMSLSTFFIDKYPVTNENYAAYLASSGYTPDDSFNWLANWDWKTGKPVVAAGASKKPVTFVGMAEARSYCAWRGARLPHGYEWQYAAQGTDGRTYPWGATSCASCYPTPVGGPSNPVLADVDAHPKGASPFGVEDLVGNIWQYTDEFEDNHTRAVVVRGSSAFTPGAFGGSHWYFPPALKLNEHGKYFLMSNSYERAATMGFRCAADASGEAEFLV